MMEAEMGILRYSPEDRACRSIADLDPEMEALIAAVGEIELTLTQDPFVSLARAIVGQQLSVKAAGTIWGRFSALGSVEPGIIVNHDEDTLRAVGLSRAKVAYVKDLAVHALQGELNMGRIASMESEEIIADLMRVKGIGRWTAEMFLIFSLGRPDVLAVDDLGLRRAAGLLVGKVDPLDAGSLAERGERWRPYRSVASLYLWEALDRGVLG